MSSIARKPVFGVSTRSDTNQAVQSQKMDRGLKFLIQKVEGFYYLCSENKGADQLCSYCAADLHLCFCIYGKRRFSRDVAQIILARSAVLGHPTENHSVCQ